MTIFVADDHTIFRKGLLRILSDLSDVELVGEAGDGDEALEALRNNPPDVALLDVAMPGKSGLDIARIAQEEHWTTKLIILTMYKGEAYLNRALDLGVHGYILKEKCSIGSGGLPQSHRTGPVLRQPPALRTSDSPPKPIPTI